MPTNEFSFGKDICSEGFLLFIYLLPLKFPFIYTIWLFNLVEFNKNGNLTRKTVFLLGYVICTNNDFHSLFSYLVRLNA